MKQQKKCPALLVLMAIAALAWTWSTWQMPQSAAQGIAISRYDPWEIEIGLPGPKLAPTTVYRWSGRDIFKPERAVRPDRGTSPASPTGHLPVSLQPELPLKYFGYGTVPNRSPRRAFLSDGDNVFIVSEGDVVLGRYRITRIGDSALEFVEIPSGLQGRLLMIEDSGKSA